MRIVVCMHQMLHIGSLKIIVCNLLLQLHLHKYCWRWMYYFKSDATYSWRLVIHRWWKTTQLSNIRVTDDSFYTEWLVHCPVNFCVLDKINQCPFTKYDANLHSGQTRINRLQDTLVDSQHTCLFKSYFAFMLIRCMTSLKLDHRPHYRH